MIGSSTLMAASAISSVIFSGSWLLRHVVYGQMPVSAVGTQISESGNMFLALCMLHAVVSFRIFSLFGRIAVIFALIVG